MKKIEISKVSITVVPVKYQINHYLNENDIPLSIDRMDFNRLYVTNSSNPHFCYRDDNFAYFIHYLNLANHKQIYEMMKQSIPISDIFTFFSL